MILAPAFLFSRLCGLSASCWVDRLEASSIVDKCDIPQMIQYGYEEIDYAPLAVANCEESVALPSLISLPLLFGEQREQMKHFPVFYVDIPLLQVTRSARPF